MRLTLHSRKRCHHDVRNAVAESSTAIGKQLRVGEAVGISLPQITLRDKPLPIPGSVDLSFIHKRRCKGPCVPHLKTSAGTAAVLGATGDISGARKPARQQNIELVMNVAQIDILLLR